MESLAERVAVFLRKVPARAHCIRCVAILVDEPEAEIRQAAQLVIVQEGFGVRYAACSRCLRATKLIMFNPFTDPLCALCRTPIYPTAVKRTIEDRSYHAGCWDRRVRGFRPT